jgi:hypothetical protein
MRGLRGSQKIVCYAAADRNAGKSDFPVKVYSCCVISLALIPLFRMNDVLLFRDALKHSAKQKITNTNIWLFFSAAALWCKKINPESQRD